MQEGGVTVLGRCAVVAMFGRWRMHRRYLYLFIIFEQESLFLRIEVMKRFFLCGIKSISGGCCWAFKFSSKFLLIAVVLSCL